MDSSLSEFMVLNEINAVQNSLSEDDKRMCASGIKDLGFETLAAFLRADMSEIGKLRECSAACKAWLRRLRMNRPGGHERKDLAQGNAAAADVLKAVAIAKAMTVARPNCGPMAMCRQLAEQHSAWSSRAFYVELARLEALCGNMVSVGETKCALNCWCNFARSFGIVEPGKELPPSVDGLLAWSRIFAKKSTFNNYLTKLGLACEIAGVSREACNDPALKRAKRTIGSLEGPSRPKRSIPLALLEKLVSLCILENDSLSQILYLASYSFLLRVPSEALPLVLGSPKEIGLPLGFGTHSRLTGGDDRVTLRLARRKNKPQGSFMTRTCWCKQSAATCPVHALGKLLFDLPQGKALFPKISAADVNILLRSRLRKLGEKNPDEFGTHDFRRGHARDLARAKSSTAKSIMEMGEWASSAMLRYLDTSELETTAVIEAHMAESESEHE